MSLPVSPPGLDLFSLLPAVYRIRDMQLAQSLPLLTDLEQATLAQLKLLTAPGMPPLAADQQTLLDELNAKAHAARSSLCSWSFRSNLDPGQRSRSALRRPVHRDVRPLGHSLYRRFDRLSGREWYRCQRSTIRVSEVAETISSDAAKAPCWSWSSLRGTPPHGVRTPSNSSCAWRHAVHEPRLRCGTTTPRICAWQTGLYIESGFDRTAHKVDVRRVSARSLRRGAARRYNVQNIGIFLWSLRCVERHRDDRLSRGSGDGAFASVRWAWTFRCSTGPSHRARTG